MQNKDIQLLYVDLFCGAGGTSTGVESARINGKQCAKVIACVNHDANAIASHAANHPEALHFTEDIRTLDLTALVAHVALMRMKYPEAKLVLWASLECTNFSKAKGGLPRDADSRTLALHLFRYIEALGPDFIQIENVEEFMSWGELDASGKPASKKAGTDYMRWIKRICAYGYDFDHRILNSADFGAYTARKRFFGQFAYRGLSIAWPESTHCKGGGTGLFNFEKWKPVKEVLDFSDEGQSIFNRKKPLVEKTLERVYLGLIKHVAGGKNAFLSKYYSGNPADKNISIEEPAQTITANRKWHYLMNPQYLNAGGSVDSPSFTLIARMDKMPPYLVEVEGGRVAIDIYESDSPYTKKIKAFMALYGILDIKMRMLRIDELKLIMGFPRDYRLIGTQADQKKYIGNAVEVNMAKALCRATAMSVLKLQNKALTA